MIRRKDLEIILQRLAAHPQPKVWLEQYTIPSCTAAEVLFIASNVYRDINRRSIMDLGCGTGRLAIGASILGAKEVIAVDIDPVAIKIAKKNDKVFHHKNIEWINSDIDAIEGSFDTVIMNPPFGTRERHADRKFLLKAMSISNTTYSLHKRSTRAYLLSLVADNFGKVESLYEMLLQIPRTYDFHKRKNYAVEVDLYVIRSTR